MIRKLTLAFVEKKYTIHQVIYSQDSKIVNAFIVLEGEFEITKYIK